LGCLASKVTTRKNAQRLRAARATMQIVRAAVARRAPDAICSELRSEGAAVHTRMETSAVIGSRPRVLFVDDHPRILDGFKDALRREEYEIVTAESAAAALELLAKAPVDVVVSDECMPRMSGSDFLWLVHKRYPRIVRVMLTGQASLTAATRAIDDGLYRFLSKPIAPEELKRVVRDALRSKFLAEAQRRLHTQRE
jgi:response regulator RpfG family c-di-GMP phosphodiesterase